MGVINKIKTAFSRVSARFNDHVHQSVLSNGIHLASQRWFGINDTKFRFSVIIKAGAFEDPEGKEGVAHYLEHVLMPWKICREIEDRKGCVNARTSADRIEVDGWIEDTPENRAYAMQAISNMLTENIGFDLHEKEKRRILNEIGITEDKAVEIHTHLIGNAFEKKKFVYQILGIKETVRNITIDDLNDFKTKWFKGSNIFISFTGNSNHNDFRNMAEARLAAVPAGSVPERFMSRFKAGDSRKNRENVSQLYFGFLFPNSAISDREHAIADLTQGYLNRMVTQKILEDDGLVYDIGAYNNLDWGKQNFFFVAGNMLPEDGYMIAPKVAEVLTQSCQFENDSNIEKYKALIRDGLASDRELRPMITHGVRDMNEDLARKGKIRTLQERIDMLDNIKPSDVRQYIAEMISQKPAIIAYGDHSKLHSYDDFVRMLEEKQKAPAQEFAHS